MIVFFVVAYMPGPLGVTSMSTVEAVLYPTHCKTASTVLMHVTPGGPCVVALTNNK